MTAASEMETPEPRGVIYVAGPIRGFPGRNYARFNRWAKCLRAEGWKVINPTEMSELYGTAEELEHNPRLLAALMEKELAAVRERADAIFLLRGWERSAGARRELAAALERNLEIIQEAQ